MHTNILKLSLDTIKDFEYIEEMDLLYDIKIAEKIVSILKNKGVCIDLWVEKNEEDK